MILITLKEKKIYNDYKYYKYIKRQLLYTMLYSYYISYAKGIYIQLYIIAILCIRQLLYTAFI